MKIKLGAVLAWPAADQTGFTQADLRTRITNRSDDAENVPFQESKSLRTDVVASLKLPGDYISWHIV